MRVGRVDKHIAVVTLDRPEKLNALDMAAFRGVRDAALKLRDDASVRCVVLRGAGRAFCAGAPPPRVAFMTAAGRALDMGMVARDEAESDLMVSVIGDEAVCRYLWAWNPVQAELIHAQSATHTFGPPDVSGQAFMANLSLSYAREGGTGIDGNCAVLRFANHSQDEAVVWRVRPHM